MEKYFEDILDNNEQIIKVIKPKKSVMFGKSLLVSILTQIIFYIVIILGSISSALEENATIGEVILTALIPIGILLILFVVVQCILLHFQYKHTFFAYTNKRIIIRKGIIGVDYKSLDIKMIGASNVSVTVLDKLFHKNTGNILFGSTASPLNQENGRAFAFTNIEKPYELYKEIKSFIAETNSKEEKNKSKKEK